MGKKYAFKFIVIGSGPAGTAVATALAKAKKNVALVEGRYFGGSNLNTRDIPYQSALHCAESYYIASTSPELAGSELSINLDSIIRHENKSILGSGGNSSKPLEDAGVTCIKGYATFIDNHTIAVNDKQFTAERFILATGSRLDTKNITGADRVNFLTPETAIRIRDYPKVILVVGGGSTGVEIAEYYAKLGTKVIIMEKSPRLLPREDEEVSLVITEHLTKLGAMVLPNCEVITLEQKESKKFITFKANNINKKIHIDNIVLATGSKPVLDYGLENAGVKFKETGIIVDNNFTTSAKNIYAIGDCTNRSAESSTDRANYEGLLLANNLTGKSKSLQNYTGIIRLVKTNPEVATVGLNQNDLIAKKMKAKISLVPLSETTASKTERVPRGFVKLFADSNNHILGATIVAPHAEYIIEEIALAMRHRLSALEIATTPHVINSFNYAVKLSAKKLVSVRRAKKVKKPRKSKKLAKAKSIKPKNKSSKSPKLPKQKLPKQKKSKTKKKKSK